ncbi:hypothetical protein Acr_24g0009330 [Actinidia rufa]|uniref:Uncharacterized protein n=1 Tax=Actinidia rufa TaxID=165716 RepID=A0A7J0GVC2_9ERIC|nr:hypothetical protein Acr_24g0009330 [Actinidia rufa]
MTQGELDRLQESCSFPVRIQIRLPKVDETITSARLGDVIFYEAAFLFTPQSEGYWHVINIYPAQLVPNAWRSIISALVLWQFKKFALSLNEFRLVFGIFNNPKSDSGWLYFKARLKSLEFRRVRDRRVPQVSCSSFTKFSILSLSNIALTLSGQFYPIKDVLRLKSFPRSFSLDSRQMVASGKDNAEEKPTADAAHVAVNEDTKKKGFMPPPNDKKKGPTIKAPAKSKAQSLCHGESSSGKEASLRAHSARQQGVVLGSSLADHGREMREELENQHAAKELRRMKEEHDTALERHKKEIAKLKGKEALTKMSTIEEFKSSDDFKEAVEKSSFFVLLQGL